MLPSATTFPKKTPSHRHSPVGGMFLHPSRCPTYASKFMAYQRTIVHANRSFSGEGWVTYDLCYRRAAALHNHLHWSRVDFTLYNETFTGKAKPLLRCKYCLSEHHRAADCTYAPQSHPSTSGAPTWEPADSMCYLYNSHTGNQCQFQNCRFSHLCSRCHGSHSQVACRYQKPPPPKVQRIDHRDEQPRS